MYLYTDPCLIDYYNDLEFLHTDGEENPAARVCTKACDLARRVLLFFNAVVLCSGGTAHQFPLWIAWMDYRFREVSCGCLGR